MKRNCANLEVHFCKRACHSQEVKNWFLTFTAKRDLWRTETSVRLFEKKKTSKNVPSCHFYRTASIHFLTLCRPEVCLRRVPHHRPMKKKVTINLPILKFTSVSIKCGKWSQPNLKAFPAENIRQPLPKFQSNLRQIGHLLLWAGLAQQPSASFKHWVRVLNLVTSFHKCVHSSI